MNRYRTTSLVLAMAIIGLSTACAQQDVPQSDPARLVVARRLIRDSGLDAGLEKQAELMRKMFTATLDIRTQPDQVAGAVDQTLTPILNQRLSKLEEQIAAAYASDASLADLQAIDAFYRSPLGQRSLDLQHEVVTQMQPMMLAWVSQVLLDGTKAKADARRRRGNTP